MIPYLTVYAVLPSSLLFLFAYSWGTQRFRCGEVGEGPGHRGSAGRRGTAAAAGTAHAAACTALLLLRVRPSMLLRMHTPGLTPTRLHHPYCNASLPPARSREKLFNIIIGVFLSFYVAFALLYPHHDYLHLDGLAERMAPMLPNGLLGACQGRAAGRRVECSAAAAGCGLGKPACRARLPT